MNKVHIRGSTLINSIAASPGLLEYIDESKLMNHNDIALSGNRGYIVNMNFEAYFDEKLSQWDEINQVVLNPVQRSHHKRFIEELEKQLDIYQIENDLNRVKHHLTY